MQSDSKSSVMDFFYYWGSGGGIDMTTVGKGGTFLVLIFSLAPFGVSVCFKFIRSYEESWV